MVWRPVTSCDLANPVFIAAVETTLNCLDSSTCLCEYTAHIYNIHIPSCRSMEVIYTNACSCASTFVLGSHFVLLGYECSVVHFHPQIGEDYSIRQHLRLLKWKGEDVAVLEAAKSCYCLLLLVVGCLYLVPSQLEQKTQGLYICICIYIYIIWYLHTMNTTHILQMIHGCTCLTLDPTFQASSIWQPTRRGSMRRTRADHNRKFRSQILGPVQSKETKDN